MTARNPATDWMSTHGWTTREHVEETTAAIDAILYDALDKCPPGDAKDYDVEVDEIKAALAGTLLAPTHIHNSGGGLHARWELKEPIFKDEDPELYARAVKIQNDLPHLLCADTLVCQPHSLLRMPGTINKKYPDRGDLLVERVGGSGNAADLTELEDFCDLLREHHAPFLIKKEKPKANGHSAALEDDDRDAEQILAEMAPGDFHNSKLRATAKLLASCTVMVDDIDRGLGRGGWRHRRAEGSGDVLHLGPEAPGPRIPAT